MRPSGTERPPPNPRSIGAIAVLAGSIPVIIALCVDVRHVWDALSAGAVIGTGVVVFWYTTETQRLRENSGAQVEAARSQVEATISATRSGYRPFLVAELTNLTVFVRNIGSGPALHPTVRVGLGRDLEEWSSVIVIPPGGREIPSEMGLEWGLQFGEVRGQNTGPTMLISAAQDQRRGHIEVTCSDLDGHQHRFLHEIRGLHDSRLVAVESWGPSPVELEEDASRTG